MPQTSNTGNSNQSYNLINNAPAEHTRKIVGVAGVNHADTRLFCKHCYTNWGGEGRQIRSDRRLSYCLGQQGGRRGDT